MVDRFIGRERELALLDNALETDDAQFFLIYGRRRVGKTTLVLRWAEKTGRPFLYWVATRDTPARVRADFCRALWTWAYPESRAAPQLGTWKEIFETTAQLLQERAPAILVMDEFSYAAESDPSLPSNLQAAWDHLFHSQKVTIVLTGSHIGLMTGLTAYHAPLYGRFTAQLPVEPLPFSALGEFLPRYDVAQRVAVYAVVGGVPAYLERFRDRETLGGNVKRLFVQRTGMFRSEPFLLIGDVLRRETQTYEAVMKAVASGLHSPLELARALELTSAYLSPYLKQLEALHLLERRLPATLPPKKQANSRKSRYYLADPYLRFYYRFIATNLNLIEQELTDLLWQRIREQFRAFVGLTAFEDLCRQWVLARARAGELPFLPERVGSHWSKNEQVDVVAINWRDRAILLGECKWGTRAVRESVLRDLQKKAKRIVPGDDWSVHYILFARAGFTAAARRAAEAVGASMVDLEALAAGLE